MTDRMQRPSHVYFARAENLSRWKLGVSIDPERAVKVFLPPPLTVVYTTPGDRHLKNQVGFYLGRHRIKRREKDWYHLTCEEIETLIRDLEEQGPEMLRHVRRLTEERRAAVKGRLPIDWSRDETGGAA